MGAPNKAIPGFTARYNLNRLVYYEAFVYPDVAIAREKEIKGSRPAGENALLRDDDSQRLHPVE